MVYAIWDLESGYRIGWHATEAAALEDVRDTVARFGRGLVESWALARHDGDATDAIAEGDALIDRALGHAVEAKE